MSCGWRGGKIARLVTSPPIATFRIPMTGKRCRLCLVCWRPVIEAQTVSVTKFDMISQYILLCRSHSAQWKKLLVMRISKYLRAFSASSVFSFERSQLGASSASRALSFERSQLRAFSAWSVLSFECSQLRAFSASSVLSFERSHIWMSEQLAISSTVRLYLAL